MSKASKVSYAMHSSSGTKNGYIICEGGTEGVVTGRARRCHYNLGRLCAGQESTVTSAQVSSGIGIMHPSWVL